MSTMYEDLKLIVEALEQSRPNPKAFAYDEAKERHAGAIAAAKRLLVRAVSRQGLKLKGMELYVSSRPL